MSLTFCPLYSGSSGNCTYVSDGTTGILIDAGLSGRQIIDALAQIPEIIADPAPMTEVSSLGESGVVLTVRGWCKNADYWTAYFAATRKVKESFAAKGVHIPFPQLDVHVHNA